MEEMQNMYQPQPKQRRRINGTQEQCSKQKNEVPWEVIQNKNDTKDDDDNEDKEEQEWKPEQHNDDYDEESEGTTTAAKSEGSDLSKLLYGIIFIICKCDLDM